MADNVQARKVQTGTVKQTALQHGIAQVGFADLVSLSHGASVGLWEGLVDLAVHSRDLLGSWRDLGNFGLGTICCRRIWKPCQWLRVDLTPLVYLSIAPFGFSLFVLLSWLLLELVLKPFWLS